MPSTWTDIERVLIRTILNIVYPLVPAWKTIHFQCRCLIDSYRIGSRIITTIVISNRIIKIMVLFIIK